METKRIKTIIRLFEEEIKAYVYEEYISTDNIKRIRTYIILDDLANNKIKLEELGESTEEKIAELKEKGYTNINAGTKLIKK